LKRIGWYMALVIAGATVLVTACGGGTSAPSQTANTTLAAPSSTGAVGTSTTGVASPATCSAPSPPSAAKAPPVSDAAAVRDTLLAIARCTPIPPGTAFTESPIEEAWSKAYPNLKSALFSSSEPTVMTFSVESGFLTSRSASGTPHYNDRIFSFALKDALGRCAGAVLVIPAVNGKIADGPPTVFQPVDMSATPNCSADSASNSYQPGAI
jgi:hypothetical protein